MLNFDLWPDLGLTRDLLRKNEVCFRTVSLTPEAATSLQCFHAPVGVFIYQGTISVVKGMDRIVPDIFVTNEKVFEFMYSVHSLKACVLNVIPITSRPLNRVHHPHGHKSHQLYHPHVHKSHPTIPPSGPQITLTTINTLSILVLHLRT